MRSHLERALILALCMNTVGCVYVTQVEYDGYWDNDGDGWPLDDDCDDDNAEIYPYAPDVRGDGCDSDCGMEPDKDGDDWPDAADCGPGDPDKYPCSPAEVDGDGIDHDCDGRDQARPDSCVDDTEDPDFPDATSPKQCGGGE